ncbi:phosphate regulon sensor protein [Candidatus Arthromitus sp. SFB-mouse-Japan]|uniref:sensor histidine kinase n=1 Tax=Candidatus Arthromitus sp. SFB-mouse TaxID=49118 RepID=UPI00021B7D09|nr:HAMP domain-containing sensor histidine kinase [Candidatus Arthromitus sp. SFB-mouse]EIA27427.1 Sensor protein [Candidatus Arthromitus sp. SFB-co]EIA27500.1 Sensor protein [Candidatus Arthromitus sp. SFB-5]EIA30859.1 Sensor protein [Candidatus Arthromitus sp. SFB-mouse-SU]EGX28734.1 phosphate regulon sensor histidine kinase [Candidatus Arthromitus sp. SFB-mouse-NYU]BAK56590.1 phosphate regulon sensor protein [Candidatus Arthromitus sp. SFB-mouse-Japan]
MKNFNLILIVFLLILILSMSIWVLKFNNRIKRNLLNILTINSNDYLESLVNMANKKSFRLENILDLIKLKFNKVYKKYDKLCEDNYVLERTIDILEYGVLILDSKNRIYYVNDELGKLFNILSLKEIHNKLLKETNLRWLLEFSNDTIFEIPEEYSFINISCYIKKINNNFTVYTFKNITEQKKIDNMSAEFISNITHELKTPLTSIIGFADTLKEVEDENDRQIFYDIISKEAIRLNNLISDILIFSEIQTQNDITKQKIDIMQLLYSVKQLLTPQISNNININIIGDRIKILSCEKYIMQIFLNIIDNSIKHSFGENIDIICKEDSKNVCIKFSDDGIGIPKNEIENIFKRFYKIPTSKTKFRGTGLGLSIVYGAVKKISGNLEVFNNEDKGVTFKVNIPKNKVE